MKNKRTISLALAALLTMHNQAAMAYPSKAVGILTVETMTQGQLIWLKGRVGEGVYTFTEIGGRRCSLKIPVAIGSISDSSIGFSQSNGLTIAVISARLNKALIGGKRLNHQDWHFTRQHGEKNADALIVSGINEDEGFVLNSKRKWLSWFTGEKREVKCI
ncbi:hypothetical protein AB4259_07840 [Vibrio amylolyticus]|uniref:hypothetical protein n=1 Tax=Vibrio amylolyticus TaxID=2847292 RepID=UPI0035524A43